MVGEKQLVNSIERGKNQNIQKAAKELLHSNSTSLLKVTEDLLDFKLLSSHCITEIRGLQVARLGFAVLNM